MARNVTSAAGSFRSESESKVQIASKNFLPKHVAAFIIRSIQQKFCRPRFAVLHVKTSGPTIAYTVLL